MFPITEAWDGYEIDDAVLEEYNATMEASPDFYSRAADRAYARADAAKKASDQASGMASMWKNMSAEYRENQGDRFSRAASMKRRGIKSGLPVKHWRNQDSKDRGFTYALRKNS